jgi:hypothetical protein
MFWYPDTGSISYALNWSAGFLTTSLAAVALIGMVRVALFALRPVQYGHGGPALRGRVGAVRSGDGTTTNRR